MDLNSHNPFATLIKGQKIMEIPSLTLEIGGDELKNVPVAYKTWGTLNEAADNAMVVCHALSGSADVADWWGPLLGEGRAFDLDRYFIVCVNALGSPYGTASPVTTNPQTGKNYGPEFPLTTIKDDVRLQRAVLDRLGVKQVAVVIGGSMGGMMALEYLYFGKEYVRSAVILASCAYHSAWGISWGEAQRQSIYADPKYKDGYYDLNDPPRAGLGAARMSALLTYRSRNSFDSKFGRNIPNPKIHKGSDSPDMSDAESGEGHWSVHNHGNKRSEKPVPYRPTSAQHYFTAQSYLRYQGERFVNRFDANCYISITRKLDTHDVSRGRTASVVEALELIEQPVLVIGIPSDGLFTFSEQEFMHEHIKNSELHEIQSPDGHDAFLLEFADINDRIHEFLIRTLPDIMKGSDNAAAPIGDSGTTLISESSVTEW